VNAKTGQSQSFFQSFKYLCKIQNHLQKNWTVILPPASSQDLFILVSDRYSLLRGLWCVQTSLNDAGLTRHFFAKSYHGTMLYIQTDIYWIWLKSKYRGSKFLSSFTCEKNNRRQRKPLSNLLMSSISTLNSQSKNIKVSWL
jgi:hypothetical protein